MEKFIASEDKITRYGLHKQRIMVVSGMPFLDFLEGLDADQTEPSQLSVCTSYKPWRKDYNIQGCALNPPAEIYTDGRITDVFRSHNDQYISSVMVEGEVSYLGWVGRNPLVTRNYLQTFRNAKQLWTEVDKRQYPNLIFTSKRCV